jgi:hypothetical protein
MKFLLLNILTMSVYSVYWFYRNWKQIKLADNRNIWPVPRAIFSLFFVHALFADVDRHIKQRGIDHVWHPVLAATLFVVIAVFGAINGQLTQFNFLPPWFLFVVFLFPLLYSLVLLPGQKAINVASDDVGGTKNARLTTANWIWMALGVFVWIANCYAIATLYAGLQTAGSLSPSSTTIRPVTVPSINT